MKSFIAKKIRISVDSGLFFLFIFIFFFFFFFFDPAQFSSAIFSFLPSSFLSQKYIFLFTLHQIPNGMFQNLLNSFFNIFHIFLLSCRELSSSCRFNFFFFCWRDEKYAKRWMSFQHPVGNVKKKRRTFLLLFGS